MHPELAELHTWLSGVAILQQIVINQSDGAIVSINYLQHYFDKRKISLNESGLLLEVWGKLFPYAKKTRNSQRNTTITLGIAPNSAPTNPIKIEEIESPDVIAKRLGANSISKHLLQQAV